MLVAGDQQPLLSGGGHQRVFSNGGSLEQIPEYAVIPTFDLLIEMPDGAGLVMAYRTIKPYKDLWALPGLRMYKPEGIDDALVRIVRQELGLEIDVAAKRLLGQYVGKFEVEHGRQDLSTGYVVPARTGEIRLNRGHFSAHRLVRALADVPEATGAMYRYYLERYFE